MTIKIYEFLIKFIYLVPFLPLVKGNARYDLLIYPILLTILIRDRFKTNYIFNNIKRSIIWSSFAIAIGAIATLLSLQNNLSVYIPYIDNVLQFPVTLAILILTLSKIKEHRYYKLSRNLGLILILGCSFSAILGIISFKLGRPFLSEYFVSTTENDPSVALLASLNLRYVGLFNQVIESSQAYLLALLVCHFLINMDKIFMLKLKQTKIFKYFILLNAYLILIGGYLLLSKLFLIVGTLLFSYLFWWPNIVQWRIKYISLLNIVIFLSIIPLLVYFISDLNLNWFSFNSIFNVFFSSRYTSDGTLRLYSLLFSEVPIIGNGFVKHPIVNVFDSGPLEYLSYFGILGTFFIILSFLEIFKFRNIIKRYINASFYTINKPKIPLYILILLSISIIGLTGGPTITANRVSIIYPNCLILFSMPLIAYLKENNYYLLSQDLGLKNIKPKE
tara:strand:- start:1420 stop:2760 length:1341 start_codon:yes stop_codon:yes gene_type:complete